MIVVVLQLSLSVVVVINGMLNVRILMLLVLWGIILCHIITRHQLSDKKLRKDKQKSHLP